MGGSGVVRVEHLGISGIIGIRRVQLDQRRPRGVIPGRADHVIQFDRVEMAEIFVVDAGRNGAHHRVIGRIAPILKIIPAHPEQIIDLRVARPEILAILARLIDAVRNQDLQPAPGLRWVQEDEEAVVRGQREHPVDPGEVRLVRCGQIAGGREGDDAVVRAPVRPAPRIGRAQEIDPDRIKAAGRPIGEELGSLRLREVDNQGLGRVANHQVRDGVLID
jgi:hypothetical protein